MAVTPQTDLVVHTPSTPRHGPKYDTNYRHNYATRENTRRERHTKRAAETPPLQSRSSPQRSHNRKQSRQSPKAIQSPSSTRPSPHQASKHQKVPRNHQNGSMDDFSIQEPSLDPSHLHQSNSLLLPTLNSGANMLPTPVKTPRKRQLQQGALRGGGRVLFSDRAGDPMPAARKGRKSKGNVGFSLYDSIEDHDLDADNDIHIYTDSKDKIPELDPSEDNPFLEQPKDRTPPPEPRKGKHAKTRQLPLGLDGSKEIEEAFNRDEGMVYVFRGKKIYRKFPEEDKEGSEVDEEIDGIDTVEGKRRIRPLRRSAIKPRKLFETPEQRKVRTKSDTDDEEAPTDIDDVQHGNGAEDGEDQMIETPVKEKFMPTTPPDTAQPNRSSKGRIEPREAANADDATSPPEMDPSSPSMDTGLKIRGKKISPFDGWPRTKPGADGAPGKAGKGKKRVADTVGVEDSEVINKRIRAQHE